MGVKEFADTPSVLVAVLCDSRKHAIVPITVALDSFADLDYPRSRLGLLLLLTVGDYDTGLLDAANQRTAAMADSLHYFRIMLSEPYSAAYIQEIIAHYRQKIIEEARRTEFDYLLFLDSDTAIPPFALRKLVALRAKVASGVCTPRWAMLEKAGGGRDSIQRVFAYRYTLNPIDRQEIRVNPRDGVVDVDWVSFGCVLISREAFSKVDFGGYLRDSTGRVGEDGYFCLRAAELFREKVKLHTEVRTAHLDEAGNVNVLRLIPAHRLVRIVLLSSGIFLSPEHEQQLQVSSRLRPVTLIGPSETTLPLQILGSSAQTSVRLTRAQAPTLGLDSSHPVAGKRCRARLRNDNNEVEFEVPMESVFSRRQLVVATKNFAKLGLQLGERVAVEIESLKPLILTQLPFTVEDIEESTLYLDSEEANAAWIDSNSYGELLTHDDMPNQLIHFERTEPYDSHTLARQCGWLKSNAIECHFRVESEASSKSSLCLSRRVLGCLLRNFLGELFPGLPFRTHS